MVEKEYDYERSGNLLDILNRRIFPGTIYVKDGKIVSIKEENNQVFNQYILPGFIDSHVHIESSMLPPTEFARLSSVHGTVATVSDPHEIANVLGIEGVRYMIKNALRTPFHFYFGVPSCVPATAFETSGASITKEDVYQLFKEDHLKYLSEMMNYPGVLNGDKEIMDKIKIAKDFNLVIDGHAPGLMGDEAIRYIAAGISTDHECYMLKEAEEKVKAGMKILIREGSAAKNYEALAPLIPLYPDQVMFCSDDKHPDALIKGQINDLVKRSIKKGYDLYDVLKIACINPVTHYGLDVGLLKVQDRADFIIVDDLKKFNILETHISGNLVAKRGKALLPHLSSEIVNHFNVSLKRIEDFKVTIKKGKFPIIEVVDGELITHILEKELDVDQPININQDILKIVNVCRYKDINPSIAFIHGFGLKEGAIASSVAHDSHNIIAVGTNDRDLLEAVNKIIEVKGGIAVSLNGKTEILPLPIAGLLSPMDGYDVEKVYTKLDRLAKEMGSTLKSPFMTLSFMALLVIPSLKLSDQGLFDGRSFQFVPK